MPDFVVKIVRREWLSYWYEYWNVKETPSDEARKLGEEGHLSVSFIIKAKDKNEAESLCLAQHPGFVAISTDTEKLS